MKKCIFSALCGALAMLIFSVAASLLHANREQEPATYEHIDYVSAISQEECFVCSEKGPYWGEDNVGIVNLNTFELLRIEINRYDDQGEIIEEEAGYMSSSGLTDNEAKTYAHAYTFPDQAYASIQMTGVRYAIDRESIQTHLCQDCLDSINKMWFDDKPPAEFAIVSFEDRTIQPILNVHPWFGAGDYGIDCEFKPDGRIDLLIHYCPNRYE